MRAALAALIVAFCIALPGTVLGQIQQIPCSEQDPTEHFLNSFGETVHVYGTSEAGAVLLRIFGNAESGTWTILMSRAMPQTLHCVIAAGQSFDVVPIEDHSRPKGTSASYDRP